MSKSFDSARKVKITDCVSAASIAANLILSAGKLVAGVFGHSAALISDAVHSASDVLSTLFVIVGVHLSGKKPDRWHEYGHERIECLASILLAAALFITGLSIGFNSASNIYSGGYLNAVMPGSIALVAAGISIAVKELMYWITRYYARQISSGALMADAWHHRSDALSSVGSLIGVFAARHGFPIADPIAGIIICIFILKAAVDIFRDAAGQLTDRACSPELEEEMRDLISSVDGVQRVDLLRTRTFGNRLYVEIELAAIGELPLYEVHGIAENVHHLIEEKYPQVKHCMVHVNPVGDSPDELK